MSDLHAPTIVHEVSTLALSASQLRAVPGIVKNMMHSAPQSDNMNVHDEQPAHDERGLASETREKCLPTPGTQRKRRPRHQRQQRRERRRSKRRRRRKRQLQQRKTKQRKEDLRVRLARNPVLFGSISVPTATWSETWTENVLPESTASRKSVIVNRSGRTRNKRKGVRQLLWHSCSRSSSGARAFGFQVS